MVCSEARNNIITAFDVWHANEQFAFEGIRRLYAAACARGAWLTAEAGGVGCSDLRGNKLRDFKLEDFLLLALQLEELCAAALRMRGAAGARSAGGA